MGYHGKCAVGIYAGVRKFEDGRTATGVFGLIGIEPPCNEPVTARCQLADKGQLWPYYWLACDKPEHRKNAGVIQELDENGKVVRVIRMLDTRTVVHETVIVENPEIILPKKKTRKKSKRGSHDIPRNNPNCTSIVQRKPR